MKNKYKKKESRRLKYTDLGVANTTSGFVVARNTRSAGKNPSCFTYNQRNSIIIR